jgi:hypothetical protein
LPFLRDCAAAAAALAVSSRVLSFSPVYAEGCREAAGLLVMEPAAAWLRCEDVRGGGMGAPAARGPADAVMAGDECVDGGSCWARGVLSVELLETAGEW